MHAPTKQELEKQKIVDTLTKHRVPLWKWGTGKYWSLADFLRYASEDQFFVRDGLELTVEVHAVVVVVIHQFRRKWLELYEDRQIFSNGTVLQRKNFNGIAETLKRGETTQEGAARCLAEELQFRDPSVYQLSELLGTERRDPVASEKWPGIKAQYNRYLFECSIERKIFRKNGYEEREGDRTIFFQWRPRRQLQLQFS